MHYFIVGFINITSWSPSYDELERLNDDLELGGIWTPRTCQSRDRVALVVPYRDRETHLRTFLHNIHPFLQKQQLHYGVYVVQQVFTGVELGASLIDFTAFLLKIARRFNLRSFRNFRFVGTILTYFICL